jgi:hypothetical protein
VSAESGFVGVRVEDLDVDAMRFRAQLAADWFLAFSVVRDMVTIRRVGMRLFDEITANMLRGHQEKYFLAGLKKLRLDEDPSDAIRCARYHALSNAPGGLNTSYGIESNDKAWVFYNLPYLRDRWTGTSSFVYEDYYAANMAGWHSNNGVLLGNLGLGFVVTHLVSRGDPYDAGYFLDSHRTLDRSERIRVRFGEEPPAEMEIHRPEFDPVEWPPVRKAKVQRRHMVDYASAGLLWNEVKLGSALTAEITELTLRSLLFQTWQDLVLELGLGEPERPAVQRVGLLFAATHDLAGDPVEVEVGSDVVQVGLGRHWATSTAEWEGRPLPAELSGAFLRAWQVFARHVDRNIGVRADWDAHMWHFAVGSGAAEPAPSDGAVNALMSARVGSLAP